MGTEEVWKPVPGYEGYYKVSNRGNVLSFHRSTRGIPMAPGIGRYNQRIVVLSKNGSRVGVSVGSLVARAFLGKPENPEHVAVHINRDTSDDRPENLVWGPRPGRGPAKP